MTTAIEEHDVDHEHADHADHPSDLLYVKVAAILAFLTALEVGTYFIEEASTQLLVGILFPLMFIKFGTVIMYFMHLKYDNPLFKRLFYAGLFLALFVYIVAMLTFHYFE